MVDGGIIPDLHAHHSSICHSMHLSQQLLLWMIATSVMSRQLLYFGVTLQQCDPLTLVGAPGKCDLFALQSCTPAAPAGCLLSVHPMHHTVTVWCPCGSCHHTPPPCMCHHPVVACVGIWFPRGTPGL